jgi:GxGYxYP putative glycoside hydrolase C-terminal domain/GxGYxY sequence motif in domain of unknown function N-terminal
MSRRQFLRISAGGIGALLVQNPLMLEAQPPHQACPKSRPPRREISALRLTELTTDAWDLRLTLSCLQGAVNRSEPRLYLIHDDYDELWLNWMKERGDLDTIRWLSVLEVFKAFLPEFREAYVIDPVIPATINVATMLAGLRGGIVTTPRLSYEFDLPLGYPLDSWNRGFDFRYMGWKKDIQAYRWFFEHYEKELSRQAIAILDPKEVAIRDYLLEFKIPILWVSGPEDEATHPSASPEEEQAFAREILMKWPPNIPCLGWPSSGEDDTSHGGMGEALGVRMVCECAKFQQCSAYDGFAPTVGNLSVHSGTQAVLLQKSPPVVKLDRSKIYYSFVRTDGDGWNFLRQYYRKLFDDPAHGRVPLGWQIGPTAADTMPDILDYYYKHAAPGDCFVNALTGLGYIQEDVYAANYPPDKREEILRDYVNLSSIYRRKIDASVMCTHTQMDAEQMSTFAQIEGLQGIFANYGRRRGTTADNLMTESRGVPVFRAMNNWPTAGLPVTDYTRDGDIWFEVNDIKREAPSRRPLFLNICLGNWLTDLEMAEEIAKGLGPQYVAVRPDQLASLYKESTKAK